MLTQCDASHPAGGWQRPGSELSMAVETCRLIAIENCWSVALVSGRRRGPLTSAF
jgi:hypothetical protein